MARKEFDLTHALLCYAGRCLREGDWSALRDMNFGPSETEVLQSLTISELTNLERKLAGHVLRVQLDRDAFWMVMDQVKREADLHRLRAEFVRRDAPSDMMQALFGMGIKECALARRALGAPSGVGRPAEATEEEARRIWLAWEKGGREPAQAMAADWLVIADETGLPLRLVWRTAQQWAATDGPEPEPPQVRAGPPRHADLHG